MDNSLDDGKEQQEDMPEQISDSSNDDRISVFRDEMNVVFHKSQDSFEKQLSFISAGALTLSVGFIQDIVKDFEHSKSKIILGIGWIFLVITLLLNLISHLIGSSNANKTIKEINENMYDPFTIEKRNKIIVIINWITVCIMILGIVFIIFSLLKTYLYE